MLGLRQVLPPDLPLDRDGIPTRPLSDAELYRLLLALSAVNQPAAARIVACHVAGTPRTSGLAQLRHGPLTRLPSRPQATRTIETTAA